MRTLLGLVAVMVVGSIGCGTTVNVLGNGDDDGSGGSGGEGGSTSTSEGGQGPGPGPGPTSSTSTGQIENPPECPAYGIEPYDDCNIDDLGCTYREEQGCVVTYTCEMFEDCYGGSSSVTSGSGGYGGYGDECYEYGYWVPTGATCEPTAVPCSLAQSGDVCALPGEYCSGEYDECSYEEKWCGNDHTWVITTYDGSECCDDCCEPYYCPGQLPQQGDYCDPCWDSTGCGYEVFTDECGYVYAEASCNWDTSTWDVYEGSCGQSSVSVAAVTSTGSGAGGAGGGF